MHPKPPTDTPSGLGQAPAPATGFSRPFRIFQRNPRQLASAFCFVVLLLFGIGGASYLSIRRLAEIARQERQNAQLLTAFQKVLLTTLQSADSQQRFWITRSDADLAPISESQSNIVQNLHTALELCREFPQLLERAQRIQQLVQQNFTLASNSIVRARIAGPTNPPASITQDLTRSLRDQIQSEIASVYTEQQQQHIEREAATTRAEILSSTLVLVSSALAVIVVSAALFAIFRDFAGVTEAESSLRRSHENLEASVRIRTHELAEINTQLSQKESLLRSLIDNLPDLIFTKDAAGQFQSGNAAFLRTLGMRSESEIVGKTAFDLFPLSMASAYNEDDLEVLASGSPLFNQEEPYTIDSGELRWNLTTKIPLRDESGRVSGLLGISRDITNRRAAEQELRRSEERFSKAFNSIPAIIAISTYREGHYVDVNPAFVKSLGYSRAEALGHRALDLGIWRAPRQRSEIINRLERGEIVHEIECELRSKSGQILTVLTTVDRIQLADQPCLMFCSRDITSLKQAQTEREKLVRLIQNSQDFIATADLDGTLTYLNPAGRKLIGIDADAALGTLRITDYVPEPWLQFHHETIIASVLQTGAWGGEMQLRNLSTHELIDVWRSIFLIHDPDTGKPYCFASVTHNITRLKRAEERIRQLNQSLELRVAERTAELKDLNQELEAFAYSVSHDLRAPLRHIHGYVEMLTKATEGQLSDKSARYLQTISSASEEMAQLIDDLLAFSRTSRTELKERTIFLDDLAREIIARLESHSLDRQIVWTLHSNLSVQGDPSMIRQVLINLFDNAIKYSRSRPITEIEFGCAGHEMGRAILFVRDNGVGFDMRYAQKLFGVFERLHRSNEFEGTGIGLATVRRIISRHGGRTWAESQLDHGATFYFTLSPSPAPLPPA